MEGGNIIPTRETPLEEGSGFQRKYKVKIRNNVKHVWLSKEFLVYATGIKGFFLWKAQSRMKAGNCTQIHLATEVKCF